LPTLPGKLDVEEADRIESAILSKAPRQWNKVRDLPLGEIIGNNQLRRKQAQARKSRREGTK